jgi:hypothetical protein
MAVIESPRTVEASNVVQKYDKANLEFFSENKDHMCSAMDSTRFLLCWTDGWSNYWRRLEG